MIKEKLLFTLGVILVFGGFLFGQDAEKILADAIEKYIEYSEFKPYQMKAEFCEYVVDNNKVCMFTDAYGYLCSAGYRSPVPVDNYSYFAVQMRKSDREERWLAQIRNLYKKTPVTMQTDFPPGWDFLLNSFRRVELEGILNPQNIEAYKITATEKKTNNIISVKFENKERKELNGEILINTQSLAIHKLTIKNQDIFSPQLWDWTEGDITVAFHQINDKIFVKDLIVKLSDNNFLYFINIRTFPDKVSYADISETDYNMLSRNDLNPYVFYDKETFKGLNCYKEIFKKAAADFGGLNALEMQFVSNANKAFYISKTFSDKPNKEKVEIQVYSYLQKFLQLIQ